MGEQVPTPSPKEASLPEIKFEEIAKSPEPIVDDPKKVERLNVWNQYSIVETTDSKEIGLYNNQAARDLNFQGDKLFWMDLYSVMESSGGSGKRLVRDKALAAHDPSKYIALNELPIEARDYAEFALDQGSSKHFVGFDDIRKIKQKTLGAYSHFSSILGGKYILFTGEGEEKIVYFTQNDQGVTQPPRNWRKMLVIKSKRQPENLGAFIELFSRFNAPIKDLNSNYAAVAGDYEVSFFSKADLKGERVFGDEITKAGQNICTDPANTNVIYYCRSERSREIARLDTSADPGQWKLEMAPFSGKYEKIENLQLDPKGNFFLFNTEKGLVLADKVTLEEVVVNSYFSSGNFDKDGNIRAIDKQGYLVILDPHLDKIADEARRRRISQIKPIDVDGLFESADEEMFKREAADPGEYVGELLVKYERPFLKKVEEIKSLEDMEKVRDALENLRLQLGVRDLTSEEIRFITAHIEKKLLQKEEVMSGIVVKEVLDRVGNMLGEEGFSLASASQAREAMDQVQGLIPLVEGDTRKQATQLTDELNRKTGELFKRESAVVIGEVKGVVDGVQAELDKIGSKGELDDWLEFDLPQITSRLGALAQQCPLEAAEAHKAILKTRERVNLIAREQEAKFKREYAEVREKAVERIEATVGVIGGDVESFIERLGGRDFDNRGQAEKFVEKSPAHKTIVAEIEALKTKDPDKARVLEQSLNVALSNTYFNIEQADKVQIAQTGKQMELFGNTPFEIWEGSVKKEVEKKADVVFIADEATRGPGVKAEQILGDVGIKVISSKGRVETLRLYEGEDDEDEWRYGSVSSKGVLIPPSYMSQEEYRKFKDNWSDWSRGEGSKIREEMAEKRQALKDHYETRQKVGREGEEIERNPEIGQQWNEEYKKLLEDYGKFCSENNIVLLRRIDKVRKAPETEYANGRGYIPEWSSHWVRDEQTERYLELMAQELRMQLDLREGMLALKGHAGTGKDVLVKMFCNRTRRPYFSFDCSKWTTEYDLIQDVTLEVEGGASKVVNVPSSVLNAISTPGAVIYFNEYNAMPTEAQIVLHALMDEKRSLTLKTKSGEEVKALPSVLVIGSMNIDYPGTFDPQYATRSRMVPVEIDYPPLEREKEAGDPNPNPAISAAEPLRIARAVHSLADLTWEVDFKRNDFVKAWDKYVNGIENDAPELNSVQQFDIDVILALVKFGSKLRGNFINIFEKTKEARNRSALPVDQPLTGRELRRCAYVLSKMPLEEKGTANADQVARDFLERYFLSHIDEKNDREKIKTAMQTWTSSKRVAA